MKTLFHTDFKSAVKLFSFIFCKIYLQILRINLILKSIQSKNDVLLSFRKVLIIVIFLSKYVNFKHFFKDKMKNIILLEKLIFITNYTYTVKCI